MNSIDLTLNKKLVEILKHSLIYGLTSSLQSILGFILLPFLTIYYTPEIFGVYSILLLLSALTSSVFNLGASSGLGRFYFDDDTHNYKRKIVTTSVILSIIGAVLLVFLGFLFDDEIALLLFQNIKYSKAVFFTLMGTAFGFLLNLMTLLLRYEKKKLQFLAIIILGIVVNFIVSYTLLSRFNFGLMAPVYGTLISNFCCFTILLILKYKVLTSSLELKYFKSIIIFGGQSSIAGLFFYILDWVDRLVIEDMLDLGEVGIYSLGYRIGSIINIIVIVPFTLVWAPMRMQYVNVEDSLSITKKVLSYYTLICVFIICLTLLFGNEILSYIFVNQSYAQSMSIIPIIMLSLLFYGYQNIVDFGIYLNKKVHYYIIVSLIAIFLNILLNYFLIPIFGLIAAAYVTLVTYIFTSSSIYTISNFYFKIKVEESRILGIISLIPMLYFLISVFQIEKPLIKIFILFVLIYAIFKFWFFESERVFLRNIFRLNIYKK